MKNILFIEDESEWQSIVKKILETAGYILQGEKDIESALGKLKEFKFEVIILDLFLARNQSVDDPLISLDTLIEGLETRKIPLPPIIIVTAYPVQQSKLVEVFTVYRGKVFHFFDKSNFDKRVFLKSIKDATNAQYELNKKRPFLFLLAFAVLMTLLLLATFWILVWGTSQFADPVTQQTILKTGSALIIVIAIFISVFSQGTKIENVMSPLQKREDKIHPNWTLLKMGKL